LLWFILGLHGLAQREGIVGAAIARRYCSVLQSATLTARGRNGSFQRVRTFASSEAPTSGRWVSGSWQECPRDGDESIVSVVRTGRKRFANWLFSMRRSLASLLARLAPPPHEKDLPRASTSLAESAAPPKGRWSCGFLRGGMGTCGASFVTEMEVSGATSRVCRR